MIAWPVAVAAVLFLLVLYYMLRLVGNDKWALWGLGFKLACSIFFGAIYKFHYQAGDTLQYFRDAGVMVNYLLRFPADMIPAFFNTTQIEGIAGLIAYADQPRALFFTKIVAVFYFFGGGNYWIAGAWLALINFLCSFLLVNELIKNFSGIARGAYLSFYFLPGLVFWTSGILKETVAMAALFLIITVFLKILRNREFGNIYYWIVIAIAGYVLWELKYYYAAVAFPVLGAVVIYQVSARYSKFHFLITLLVFALSVGLISLAHYNLNFSRVAEVMYQNYLTSAGVAENKAIQYPGLDGSFLSFIKNIPLALASGLFRPIVFEVGNVLQFFAAVENTVVLILFFRAFWIIWRKPLKPNPFFAGVLFYSMSLAVLLAFSSPVFGTLSRYKVGFWPFFVLLILIVVAKKARTSKS